MTNSISMNDLPIGVARASLDGRLLAANQRFTEIVQYSNDELVEMTFQDIVHPDDYWGDVENTRKLIQRGGGSYHGEKRYIRSDGREVWVDFTVSLVTNASGVPSEFLATINDINIVKNREIALSDPIFIDPLTSLPNRDYFGLALDEALVVARKIKQRIGLLFVGLNDFDEINDSQGKWIGDEVLKAVSARLSVLISRTGLIARLRGNEFVYMVEEMPTERAVLSQMNKLNQLLEVPVYVSGQSIAVSTNIGYAVYPDHARTADGLIRLADLSMHSDRKGTRSSVSTYKRYGVRPSQVAESGLTQIG